MNVPEIPGDATISSIDWRVISPSTTLLRFVREIGGTAPLPVLDAPSGFGRNAVALAAHGVDVVCLDNDARRLAEIERTKSASLAAAPIDGPRGQIYNVCADLSPQSWPFRPGVFGAIVCVHFDARALIETFWRSLAPGGYLYLESFGGQGRNYLKLPRAGEIRAALAEFDVFFYSERPAGPKSAEAVTVKAFARKN